MTRKTSTCTWDGVAWTNPDGQTCNEDHCAMRGTCPSHVRHSAGLVTCAACVGRTRRDLTAIVIRYALIAYDARSDGIESEAMNLIGPTVHPDEAAAAARADALRGWCEWPPERMRSGDPNHPLVVLGKWELAMEDAGWLTRSDLRVTVSGAAARLAGLLDRTFPHGDEFEGFAREVATCLAHLEAVDHDERQADLGRPCPTCVTEFGPDHPAPRLRRRYARHAWARPGERCEDPDCAACAGLLDAWHCPDFPAHAWTDADYRLRVDADYLEHAPALTAQQIQQQYGIPASTIRRWCSESNRYVGGQWKTYPPRLKHAGLDHTGRRLYDVQRVLELRRTAPSSASA